MCVIRVCGARISTVRAGSSAITVGFPVSRHTPTYSGPMDWTNAASSRAVVSPWFSIAGRMPVSSISGLAARMASATASSRCAKGTVASRS